MSMNFKIIFGFIFVSDDGGLLLLSCTKLIANKIFSSSMDTQTQDPQMSERERDEIVYVYAV